MRLIMADANADQQQRWEEEHDSPTALLPMDSDTPSRGVTAFHEWLLLSKQPVTEMNIVEMGCGKGRNAIWLAEQGVQMAAFDFSEAAIAEAMRRVMERGLTFTNPRFVHHDATNRWPWNDNAVDCVIDCFASSDIATLEGRARARSEAMRVLKPGGLLFVYALSENSPFHASMITTSPGPEPRSFFHPTGKFEKTFNEAELRTFYSAFKMLVLERVRTTEPTTFYGKEYFCENFWCVFRKP